MKKFLLAGIFILGYVMATGQQLPLYSQYMMNDYLLNPAVAGSQDFSPVKLSVHKQWLGINDSPSTQALSGHTHLQNSNVGIGGIIFNDSFGPQSMMGLQASYAYHFRISRDHHISLGLSAIASQYKLDQRFLEPTNPDDPAITYNVEKTFIPDASTGVYFYGNNYRAGFTAAHLFQPDLKINRNLEDNFMVRHYFAFASYLLEFPNSPQLAIEPSMLMKATETTPPQFDINMKFYYNKDYWAALSVRPNDAFIAAFGMRINKYYFGYAYDFTFSDLSSYTAGSQEIVFGVNIGDRRPSSQSFF